MLVLIVLVSPEVSVFASSLNVIPFVIGVEPINTLKVPPAPLKLETTPSLSAETTWAGLVKNVVIASEPDLIPKIVTIPSLVLTYFTGPIGLVIYWFIRIFFAKKISFND